MRAHLLFPQYRGMAKMPRIYSNEVNPRYQFQVVGFVGV